MKKKIVITWMAAAAILLLAGCAVSDNKGTQTNDNGGIQAAQNTASDTASDAGAGTSPDSGIDSSENNQGTASSDVPEDAQPPVPGEFDGVQQEVLTDSERWSGSFSNEKESISVTYIEAENCISFTFNASGIYGKAVLNDAKSQAVYSGDDHHVVVFDLDGDMLMVSVSSEEDFDASESPLIGTYIKG